MFAIPKHNQLPFSWTDHVKPDEGINQTHARDDDNLNKFSPLENGKSSVDVVEPIYLEIVEARLSGDDKVYLPNE
jgi:hypothetical protein